MTWAQDQRLEFIRAKIAAGEQVQRSDLRDKFYISTAACATTFRAFEAKYPDLMRYCKTTKAYVPAAFVTPPSDWKTRALAAEAERDQLSARVRDLEGALETFAIMANADTDYLPDEHVISLTYDDTALDPELGGPNTLLGERFMRAFRSARQALQTPDTAKTGDAS